jgi:hypothetical protein
MIYHPSILKEFIRAPFRSRDADACDETGGWSCQELPGVARHNFSEKKFGQEKL